MPSNLKSHPKIMVPYGVQTEISRLLLVERKTVWRALDGSFPITEKAARIRKLALEKGGVEVSREPLSSK